MEQNNVWDLWTSNFATQPQEAKNFYPAIEFLTCPSDAPDTLTEPWLNYVGNAGQAFSEKNTPIRENVADGVFFDNSRNTDMLANSSAADGRETNPEIRTSMNYISSGDGLSKTMMISESILPWFYAYDGNTATPDFDPGHQVSGQDIKDSSPIVDAPHIFGFIWKAQPSSIERINGDPSYDTISPTAPSSMGDFAATGTGSPNLYESYGYPSSNHPNGVNVAFCGGQVDFMAESIDPRVYAQLMTSNSKRSSLVIGGTPDRKLPQPSDSEY
jgi:prepilin-type processing-associated H-X9-DG protein